jgi:DNA replication and repair protein RecF
MYCTHLDLTDFRLYERLRLALPPQLSVFVGDNASGKTSLLEAIYFLATTKSQRSSSDTELINTAAIADLGAPPFTRLLAEVERARGELAVEIVITRDEAREANPISNGLTRKRIKINKVARRAVDLIGQVNVVMFSPEDMTLITSPPANRRRHLDITISQIDHRYMMHLSQYNKVLLQRNALLRQLRERQRNPLNPAVKEELRYWDDELAKAGAYIVLRRQDFLIRLAALADPIHRQLMGDGPTLCLDYQSKVASTARAAMLPELKQPRPPATPELPAMLPHATRLSGKVQDEFATQLAAITVEEARRGVSLLGPHRDDFSFTLGHDPAAMDLANFGSRGQQRTAILAMKLAEVTLMEQETGDTPILLLDDILSELDANRRQFLLDAVQARPQQQALITATDLDHFTPAFLANASLFRVEDGKVATIEPR